MRYIPKSLTETLLKCVQISVKARTHDSNEIIHWKVSKYSVAIKALRKEVHVPIKCYSISKSSKHDFFLVFETTQEIHLFKRPTMSLP
mmetsp:Transcript_17769/g.51693  ORF Transcript_17769/g.51693 Transcript_17769/m.51693 type:complete len:88 (+) Transcript_17769:196-459(+)